MLPGITLIAVCAHEGLEDFGLCSHRFVRTRGLGNLGKVDSCVAGFCVGTLTLSELRAPKSAEARNSWGRGSGFGWEQSQMTGMGTHLHLLV